MTRENEIRELLKISVQKSNDRDFELTDDEVINLPFKGSYEYGFVSGALWQKKQHAEQKQQWVDEACERLENYFAPDGSIVPENISLLQDLKQVIKGE